MKYFQVLSIARRMSEATGWTVDWHNTRPQTLNFREENEIRVLRSILNVTCEITPLSYLIFFWVNVFIFLIQLT